MIKLKACLFTILALLICLPVDSSAFDSKSPPPKPLRKSEIGYLTVTSGDVKVAPALNKVFIRQQTELPLLEELKDAYLLMYSASTGSSVCKIPKLQRYVTHFVIYTDTRTALFRGAVEVETVPFVLRKGEELPVDKELESAYLADAERNDTLFTFLIPKNEEGISFNKNSAYDIFVDAQKKKGLVLYENKWVPENKAAELENAKLAAVKLEEEKMENVRTAAAQGYILLSDNQLLKGKLKGASVDSVLFEINGKERWVTLKEISDSPYEKVIALGLRYDAQISYDKAAQRFQNNELGETLRFIEAAEKILKDKIDVQDEASLKIADSVSKLRRELNILLAKNDQVLYNYHVFFRKDLDYHLALKHIYFRNSVWINPSQLCSDCKGDGLVNCKQCLAKGYIQKTCEHCQNGLIVCPVCSGDGRRICPDCNGTGSIVRKCQICNGKGYMTFTGVQYYPSYYYNPGGMVITNGGNTVVDIAPSGGNCPYPYPYGPAIWGPYSQKQVCTACNGSGESSKTCKRCNGAGKISCPKFIKCSFCDGKGFLKILCSACLGKRKVKCSTCDGHGYTGEPQKSPSDINFKDPDKSPVSGSRGTLEKIVLP